MKLGFLGGTGVEAKGLALRFAAAGASVVLGSRSPERAAKAAEDCNVVLGATLIRGLDNAQMVDASDIVFLAVPYDQAIDAVNGIRSVLTPRNIVVDITVPIIFRQGHAEYVESGELSNAETIARHLPEGVPLVAAFKTIPAAILADLKTGLDCDVFVCGDTQEAKNAVMAAASAIPALRALDAGPLRTARTLERMTVLAVELNRHYRKKGARFQVKGL